MFVIEACGIDRVRCSPICHRRLRSGGECAEDLGVVLNERQGDGLGRLVINVQAGYVVLVVAVLGKAEHRYAHRKAEHNYAQAADGGHELFATFGNVFVLIFG